MHATPRQVPPGAPRFSVDEPQPKPARSPAPRRLTSASLLAGSTEVEIEHGDAIYRLRVTSLGKLILTK